MLGDISKKISIFRHIINPPKFRLNQLRQINENLLYVCMYVCTYIHTYIQYIHIRTYVCTYTQPVFKNSVYALRMCTQVLEVHTYVCTYVYIHTYIHIRTYVRTSYIRVYIQPVVKTVRKLICLYIYVRNCTTGTVLYIHMYNTHTFMEQFHHLANVIRVEVLVAHLSDEILGEISQHGAHPNKDHGGMKSWNASRDKRSKITHSHTQGNTTRTTYTAVLVPLQASS